jgi:hypothetical protein
MGLAEATFGGEIGRHGPSATRTSTRPWLDSALGLDIAGSGWALGALGVGLFGGLGAVFSGRVVRSFGASRGQLHGA